MTKDDVKKLPMNFIYVFADDAYISLVAQYVSASGANTMRQKRENQKKWLVNLYNGRDHYQDALDDITSACDDIYGKSPKEILQALINGETVAGRNYYAGVFGVGNTGVNTFGSDSEEIYVDSNTGKIFKDGEYLDCTPLYANDKKGNTYISGYACQYEGKSYTSIRNSSGKYYAGTYGTSDAMYTADGKEYTPKTGTFWQTLETAIPQIQKFIEWILSILGLKGITRQNSVPSQAEYVDPSIRTTNSKASFGLLGALLLGGLLLTDKSTKKKRNKSKN